MYHHGDYELIENSGMKFIYEASLDMGEVEGYELVYGRDIETRYVLYPPRPRDGFILIEIEVYV